MTLAPKAGRRRGRNAVPCPTLASNRCITVSVDTARKSGWCITAPGKVVVDSGTVDIMGHADLVKIIKRARNIALQQGLPKRAVVLVLEQPWRGKPKGEKHARRSQHFVVRGLGGARHAWLSAWCEAFETKAPHRVVSVMPQTWRKAVLGITGGPELPAKEMATATRLRGVSHAPRDIKPDEAAAICIGRWSQHSGEVAAVLAKLKSTQLGAAVAI